MSYHLDEDPPCKTCLTQAICQAKASRDSMMFIVWAHNWCQPLKKYVEIYVTHDTSKNGGYDVVVNYEHARAVGKIFNYTIGR